MFTRKAIAYFSLAATLLALGLVFGDVQFDILVLALASFFFFANVWEFPEKVELQLSRRIVPDETFGGEDVRIESSVQNLASSRLTNMELLEILDPKIVPERGTNRASTSLKSHEGTHLVFEFPSPSRSNYQIGPLTVRVRDPLGLYLVEKQLGPDVLSVMPRPQRIRGTWLRPRHIGPWPGVVPSRVLGVGTEFYSMREYFSGDDPKRINWKASARLNQLIVNETEAERVTDTMIVLDTDVTFFGQEEKELFERGVTAAASMASLLLRQGNRVGLVLQGGERGSVPAGFGKRQEKRILYLLASAKPGRASLSTSYVMSLLARRMLPSRSQIVVISPLLDPEIKEGVRELVTAGYSMLVLSPAPATPREFDSETQALAFKMIMLERSITLLSLERSATIVDWHPHVLLSAVLTKVKRQRPMILG